MREHFAGCRRLLDEEGVAADLHPAAPSEVPDGLDRCDGVIVGRGAYIHISGRGARVRFLLALRRLLPSGGPLLVSFLLRAGDKPSCRWIAAIAGRIRRLRRCRDPVEIGDTLAGTFDHHFTREEIASELEQAGFELVAFAAEPYGHAVARAAGAD